MGAATLRDGGGVGYFLEVLARVEQNPQLVRSLRGTAVVTVPDDEFPDTAPLLDAGVQDFLQRLFDAVPHLMYYLSDVPQHGALLELMAARAPEHLADVPGHGLALTMSTGVLLAIVAVMTEAAAFAVRQDQLPSVVFRHLKRLPEDIRDALERAVTEQLGDPG